MVEDFHTDFCVTGKIEGTTKKVGYQKRHKNVVYLQNLKGWETNICSIEVLSLMVSMNVREGVNSRAMNCTCFDAGTDIEKNS